MALELIGKCAPTPVEIQRLVDDGFKKAELYMKEEFLTNRHVKFLSDAKREHGIEFYSIHTPHSSEKDFLEFLNQVKIFSKAADIPVIVVHSSKVDVFSKKILENLKGKMFVENGAQDHDLPFLQKKIKEGFNICFDIAHFYMSSLRTGREFYEDLETLLKNNVKSIKHMHLADAGEDMRDVEIGAGEIDFFKSMPIISKYYKSVAVVEVPGDKQLESLRKLEKIMGFRKAQR